jgi:dinuclear metal center YbgI/SA1388 family protein
MHSTFRTLEAALHTLAPPAGAAEWDNVGWALPPPSRTARQGVLVALDLTPAVAREARQVGCNAICVYHPPIFQPVKSFALGLPTHRALLDCARLGIAVYSPHTALDAAPGGLNDWLAAQCAGPGDAVETQGAARVVRFRRAHLPEAIAARLVRRLRWPYARVILPVRGPRPLRTIAVCAGAGASALRDQASEGWVTGEMSHHDLLSARENGHAVILGEHGRTERPYLPVFAARLRRALGQGAVARVSRVEAVRPGLVLPGEP